MIRKTILLAFLILLLSTNADAVTVLDFEDLYTPEYQNIPDRYGGLDWDSQTPIGVINGPNHGGGWQNGTVSGVMAAFNRYQGTPSDIDCYWADPGTFDFIGAYFTAASVGQDLYFEGHNNGVLLYAAAYSINTKIPLWIGLNWVGIDQLRINSSGQDWWVMDNFTYNPVPIPATILLLGPGLVGIGILRKRFKR